MSEKYLGFVIVIYVECKLSNYNEKYQPYLTSQIFISQGHDKEDDWNLVCIIVKKSC